MLTGHSKAVIAVNSVFPFVAGFSVALRFYARTRKTLYLKSSDYTILLALALTVAHSMAYIYCATNGGMGNHIETLSINELVVFGKVTFWNQFPYIFAVSIIKISILLFYRSIFSTQRFRLITNVIGLVIFLWTIAFFFTSMFQAWPISKNWYPDEPGTTIDELTMYLTLACTELVLDVIILTLPWTVIWSLHINTSQKWVVSGIFTLGGFVCVASGFRIYYFHTTHTSGSQDFTYDTYNIFIWTVIEPCVGVICACLPTLGPLFQGNHSIESLIGSIRSYLRVWPQIHLSKSSLNNTHGYEASEPPCDSSAKSYHKMPDDAVVLTSIHGRHSDDIERQQSAVEGIYVQTELSTSESESRSSRH